MIISLIAALDEVGCIGVSGRLPWHLREDLRRFKLLTMGHHVIMGRKTYDSIGKPLPGRTIVVVSRNSSFMPEGSQVAGSIDAALEIARSCQEEEVFIAGGAEIFAQALSSAQRIYLTRVHTRVACDVYFPDFNLPEWRELESSFVPADDWNDYPSTFSILERLHI